MSVTINTKRVIKVAAFVAVWEMVSPTTVLSTIGALALGVISTCFVEAASNYMETAAKAQRGADVLRSAQLYGVTELPDFDPELDVESLIQAHERFKNHEVLYKYYLKISPFRGINFKRNFESDEVLKERFEKGRCYSNLEVLELMRNDLQKGTCNGQVSHLLQIIKETKGSLNPSVVAKMSAEEVFYRQQLHVADIYFHTVIDIKAGIKKNEHYENQRHHPFSLIEKFDIEGYKQKKLKKHKNELENLQKLDCFASALKSQNFLATSSAETYESILETTISTLSTKDPVIGAVQMYKHILAFQYSPEGYFNYDPGVGVLIEYPDKETFFQKLREQVLCDLDYVSEINGKKGIPMVIYFKII